MIDHIIEENERRKAFNMIPLNDSNFDLTGPIDVELCRTDFRYWAARAVRIRDKVSGKTVPFILNRAQISVLEILEKMRTANKPIRLIMLKARQWGGSTLVLYYMAWIQLIHRRNWNSVICAHVKDSARNIKAMFTSLLDNYPTELLDDKDSTYTFRNFERSQNVSVITGRNCRVAVASAEKDDSSRGFDIAMAHMSEVAFWRDSQLHDPADFYTAVSSAVPLEPYTMIVIESTANGVGNFFHDEWIKAERGESDKRAVFVPWYKIDMYSMPIDDPKAFWSSLSPYEKDLWHNHKCTLEQINWYRHKLLGSRSAEHMHAEFPTTATEAFTNNDVNVFSNEVIERMRSHCCAGTKGEISRNLFQPCSEGLFEMWEQPVSGKRYIVTVDVGGRTSKADWSVISVLAGGQIPEVVGQWRGHVYHDILAEKAINIAHFYNDALLVIESNSLETADEETSSAKVLQHVADNYHNTYMRNPPSGDTLATAHIGFHVNRHTKALIINNLEAKLRDSAFIERSHLACNEYATYSILPNGTFAARKGHHDDILMTRAIALFVMSKESHLFSTPNSTDLTCNKPRWEW